MDFSKIITFIIEEKEIIVHEQLIRTIPYFDKMLDFEKSNKIVLKDIDHKTFNGLLCYLYRNTIDINCLNELIHYANLYQWKALQDYLIKLLCDMSVEEFKIYCIWDVVPEFIIVPYTIYICRNYYKFSAKELHNHLKQTDVCIYYLKLIKQFLHIIIDIDDSHRIHDPFKYKYVDDILMMFYNRIDDVPQWFLDKYCDGLPYWKTLI